MKGLTRFIQMEVCLSKLSIENFPNYLEIECIDGSSKLTQLDLRLPNHDIITYLSTYQPAY